MASHVSSKILNFLASDEGATAVEYAVMLAAILVVTLATIGSVGTATNGYWERSRNELQAHGF